jgi:hypothetical protein
MAERLAPPGYLDRDEPGGYVVKSAGTGAVLCYLQAAT